MLEKNKVCYMLKRNWVENLYTGIPIYLEAFVYRAHQNSRLPGLRRFDGDVRGFDYWESKEEAETSLEGVLNRYRKQGIEVLKSEWKVVRVKYEPYKG